MGDEPYAALLPWMVFAVIDRARNDGPLWAGVGALIAAVILLVSGARRSESGTRNVFLLGGTIVFVALAFAGALHRADTGFVAHNARALAAFGFTAIAYVSLAFAPATEVYTRPHVRSSSFDNPAFRRMNVLMTLIWGTAFAAVGLGNIAASWIGTPEAFTVFNWILPIALGAVAAHRSRICWDDFSDDEDEDPDPIRDLAIDWQGAATEPTDR